MVLGTNINPGSTAVYPDPHQNEADPKHCIQQYTYGLVQLQ